MSSTDLKEISEHYGRLKLYFNNIYNLPQLYTLLIQSSKENIVDTFILALYLRDYRHGKGYKYFGRKSFVWLFLNYPEDFMKIVKFIPEYGRWDDLLYLFPNVLDLTDLNYVRNNYYSDINEDRLKKLKYLQFEIVKVFGDKIIEDYELMINGCLCSLIAKWAPTEKDSLDRQFNTFGTLANVMGISKKDLRKKYISPLRLYIKVVESYICNGKWNKIDYSTVPFIAMKKLKQSFKKHDRKRFKVWKNKADINIYSKKISLHEIIKHIRTINLPNKNIIYNWNILEQNMNHLDNCTAVIGSPSIQLYDNTALDLSLGLSILIASCTKTVFKNRVITAGNKPKIVEIKNKNIYDKYKQTLNLEWGQPVNIEATLREILIFMTKMKEMDEMDDYIPLKTLWIVTDKPSKCLNFQEIDKMFQKEGFTRPSIIFWNLSNPQKDFPISQDGHRNITISGFSQTILDAFLTNQNFSLCDMLKNELENYKFNTINEILSTK